MARVDALRAFHRAGVAVLVAMGLSLPALAEDSSASSTPRWKVGGWLDAYYSFNSNRPENGSNFTLDTGTTAKRANAFSVNQVAVELVADPKPLGVHVTVGTGNGFEILHQAEIRAPGTGPDVWRFVYQASLSYLAPLGRGLLFQAGIYPSHIGLETFPSKDNWTYTRAWMADFSPYYQTGVMAAYSFTDSFSAQLHLLNGWQNIGENNEGKAVGVQLAWATKKASLLLNGFAGQEPVSTGDGWRLFVDAILKLQLSEALGVRLTSDFGRQGRPSLDAGLWYAAGASVRYAFNASLALVLRGEGYRDETGVITGASQTLWETTACLELRPSEHLIVKLEGRYDRSTARVFSNRESPNGAVDQALGVLGVVAAF